MMKLTPLAHSIYQRIALHFTLIFLTIFISLFFDRQNNAHAMENEALVYRPLIPSELQAVLENIQAIGSTDSNGMNDFVLLDTTPEHIKLFLNSPASTNDDGWTAMNAILLLSRANMLGFEKPSDILNNMKSWFPSITAFQDMDKRGNLQALRGPYADWQAESAAFTLVWNCFPQNAWFQSKDFPYAKKYDYIRRASRPLAQREQTNNDSLQFGQCVRELRNVDPYSHPIKKELLTEKVVDYISKQFHQYLIKNRCQGKGPDDCVMMVLQWSDLSPNDPRLAEALQIIEKDIPLSKTNQTERYAESYMYHTEEGDKMLRDGAFLRAKITSVLNSPNAWPVNAFFDTLAQIDDWAHWHEMGFTFLYQINSYENEFANPWMAFTSQTLTPEIRKKLETYISSQQECSESWEKFPKNLASFIRVISLKTPKKTNCPWDGRYWHKIGGVDFYTLLDNIPNLEKDTFNLLNNGDGYVRDTLLHFLNLNLSYYNDGNGLDNENGENEYCFSKKSRLESKSLNKICSIFISEPQLVKRKLKHSHLTLKNADIFKSHQYTFKESSDSEYSFCNLDTKPNDLLKKQEQWLKTTFRHEKIKLANNTLSRFAHELSQKKYLINKMVIWRNNTDHNNILIDMGLTAKGCNSEEEAKYNPNLRVSFDYNKNLLAIIKDKAITNISIPQRFKHFYVDNKYVKFVSDLDNDKNLEIWFGRCFNDERSCEDTNEANVNRNFYMGEISKNWLSFFKNDNGSNQLILPTKAVVQKKPHTNKKLAFYKEINWGHPDSPDIANLGKQQLLIKTTKGLQLWDIKAKSITDIENSPIPIERAVPLNTARLADKTVVVLERPARQEYALALWDTSLKAITASLIWPSHPITNIKNPPLLIPIDDEHIISCQLINMVNDIPIYSAHLLRIQNNQMSIVTQSDNKAIDALKNSYISGNINFVNYKLQSTAHPITFDTDTCKWIITAPIEYISQYVSIRIIPKIKKNADVIIYAARDKLDKDGNYKEIENILIWIAKKKEWKVLKTLDYSVSNWKPRSIMYDADQPIVVVQKNTIEFLDEQTLQWHSYPKINPLFYGMDAYLQSTRVEPLNYFESLLIDESSYDELGATILLQPKLKRP